MSATAPTSYLAIFSERPWRQCPVKVHLVSGEVLSPDPETYDSLDTTDGTIHTLCWRRPTYSVRDFGETLRGTQRIAAYREAQQRPWIVVPGSAVAYLEFDAPAGDAP